MNVDLEAAVTYPFEDEDWIKTVAIGGGLTLVPGIIWVFSLVLSVIPFVNLLNLILYPLMFVLGLVVGVVILGYLIDVMRTTIRGGTRPPRFRDWERLARDGLYGYAAALVYSLPLIVGGMLAVLVGGGLSVLTGAIANGEGGAAGLTFSLVFVLYFLLAMVYALAMGYFFPITLAAYAHEDDIRTALSLARLKRVGFDSRYALIWLVAYLGSQFLNFFVGFLNFLLIGFFLQFLVAIVYFRLLGLGYADAMDLDTLEEAQAHDSPAS